MREIARWADIPLINLQCDVDHPTQTLADLMTLREQRGENLRGLKVAMTVGVRAVVREAAVGAAGRWSRLLPRFGMDVVLAHPPGFDLMPEVLREGAAAATRAGATITFVDDMEEAFEGADVVYPKSWGRLDAFADEARGARRVGAVRGLDLRRAARWRSPARRRSTCTACPPTAAARSPTR